MKTTKNQLTESPETYSNEEHVLECFYSEKFDKFCLLFNAMLLTFKTAKGFINKRDYFISKYDLNKEE